jgi:hypothetical protein
LPRFFPIVEGVTGVAGTFFAAEALVSLVILTGFFSSSSEEE